MSEEAAKKGFISTDSVRENPTDSDRNGKTPSDSKKVHIDKDIDKDKEGDIIQLTNVSCSKTDGFPDRCPHREIIKIWNDILPELPHVSVWGDLSRSNLRARWKSNKTYQSTEWWKNFFIAISESDFLMGRRTEFQATLGWVVQPKNFEKIINGNYKNREPQTGSRITGKNIRAAEAFINEH